MAHFTEYVAIAEEVMAFLFEHVEPKGFPSELKQCICDISSETPGSRPVQLMMVWERFFREQSVDRIAIVILDPPHAVFAVDFFNLKPMPDLGNRPGTADCQRSVIAVDPAAESTIKLLVEELKWKKFDPSSFVVTAS